MAGLIDKNIRVGSGGWVQYLHEPYDEIPLKSYSREFNFVEVNSTFYEIIQPSTLEKWRKSVPPDFEFSIKCYNGLTHYVGLRPIEDAFRVFAMMQNYCEILNGKILVMQMPPSLKLNQKFVSQARDFFNSTSIGKIRIAIELRVKPDKLPALVIALMRDLNMAHIVDLTFEDPMIQTDLLYTRIFGQPEKRYSLDDKDLRVLKKKVEKSRSKTVRVVGHSLKIIEDTRRIKEVLA
jgi:uncharacterized protein YecE (DUF72 family)